MDMRWVHSEESIAWMKIVVSLRDRAKELDLQIGKATMKDDDDHWTAGDVVDEGILKNDSTPALRRRRPREEASLKILPVAKDIAEDHAERDTVEQFRDLSKGPEVQETIEETSASRVDGASVSAAKVWSETCNEDPRLGIFLDTFAHIPNS